MMTLKLFRDVFTVLVLIISSQLHSQVSKNIIWETNIEKAIKKASKENKRTLVYFSGSDWCKPCMELKNNIFETYKFKEKVKKDFILVNIDFVLDRDKLSKEHVAYIEESAKRYNKNGAFPLIQILDKNGEIEKTIDGYKGESIEYYIKEYLN